MNKGGRIETVLPNADSTGIPVKVCRVCGCADPKNVNIFTGGPQSLITKLVTVYPIIVYESDPLPKNICRECINHVTSMYNEIQRALRHQSKLISNLRAIIPNHRYIQVLGIIENGKKATADTIQDRLGLDIQEQCSDRLPVTETIAERTKCQSTARKCVLENNSRMHNDVKSIATCVKNEIQNIQSILELNGCSLLTVEGKKSQKKTTAKDNKNSVVISDRLPKTKEKSKPSPATKKDPSLGDTNHICANNSKPLIQLIKPVSTQADTVQLESLEDEDDEDNIALSQIALSAIKCPYCTSKFTSVETLSMHQLNHLRVQTPKILEKKYLHKNMRRGRLISLQNRKCIRCLNCWRVYNDNMSILDHWTLGECDFYCNICGKDFAQAPKMLREHVPAAHGVTYRSSRQTTGDSTTSIISNVNQSSPPAKTILIQPPTASSPAKPISGPLNMNNSVVCKICNKVLRNIKARNSHMRKHKFPNLYSDVIDPINTDNVFKKIEPREISREITPLKNPVTIKSSSATVTQAIYRPLHKKFLESPTMRKMDCIKVRPLHELKARLTNHAPTEIKTLTESNESASSFSSAFKNKHNKLILTVVKNETNNGAGVTQSSVSNVIIPYLNNPQTRLPCGTQFSTSLDMVRQEICQSTRNISIQCSHCTQTFPNSKEYDCHVRQKHQQVVN